MNQVDVLRFAFGVWALPSGSWPAFLAPVRGNVGRVLVPGLVWFKAASAFRAYSKP